MSAPNSLDSIWQNYIPEPNTGCWLWMGSVDGGGYGSIRIKGVLRKAHRISWEIDWGPVPEGLVVMHECDTPCCINPRHLWIGTNRANSNDKLKKGRARYAMGASHGRNTQPERTARGERQGASKLTKDAVADIRTARSAGASISSLAQRHSVARKTVSSILNGKTWRHV